MPRKYVAKRATKRWLEDAPPYILCVYDQPNSADRYTIVFGGPMQEGGETYSTAWLHALSTSREGHVSGGFEFRAHELSAYRYRNKHRMIRWHDLPEPTRILARHWAETDSKNNISRQAVLAIRDQERAITEKVRAEGMNRSMAEIEGHSSPLDA